MDQPHPLSNWRKKQRPPLKMSQVAKRLEVTTATVSRWEARKRTPLPDYLLRINKMTGIPIAELIA